MFEQAPVIVALLRGPEHAVYYRNPAFQMLFPGRGLAGPRYAEVMPEIVAAGLVPELRHVYGTGQTHKEHGILIPVAPAGGGPLEGRHFTFVYQARQNERADVDGILVFAFEVSEQVCARQASEARARRLHLLVGRHPARWLARRPANRCGATSNRRWPAKKWSTTPVPFSEKKHAQCCL